MKKGFTLVELVIVIVIVGILSVIAVPIYKGYVDKARLTEGKALASAVRNAQMIYFAEHGTYYTTGNVSYDPVLQVDARGNQKFKYFATRTSTDYPGTWAALAVDDTNEQVNLYWNIDASSPIVMEGLKLPAFRIFTNGEYTYSNS